jgi:hypothetical protein
MLVKTSVVLVGMLWNASVWGLQVFPPWLDGAVGSERKGRGCINLWVSALLTGSPGK